jgi:hypothetical protein
VDALNKAMCPGSAPELSAAGDIFRHMMGRDHLGDVTAPLAARRNTYSVVHRLKAHEAKSKIHQYGLSQTRNTSGASHVPTRSRTTP